MNHSSDPHTRTSVFNSTRDMVMQDLTLLNKRIKTARVILLTLGGILLFSIVLSVFSNRFTGGYASELVLPGIALIIIVSALLSYKQPFIFLLIPTILCSLGVLMGLYQALVNAPVQITAFGTTAIQLVIILYLVRGVIAAYRAKDLKEIIEGQE